MWLICGDIIADFASYALEGEILMKPADLMCVVVLVFASSVSNIVRTRYLKGERTPSSLFLLVTIYTFKFNNILSTYILCWY